MKTETYLPVFQGFDNIDLSEIKNSWFNKNGLVEEIIELDSLKLRNSIAEICCKFTCNSLGSVIREIKIKHLIFSDSVEINDSIICDIDYNSNVIMYYVQEYYDLFSQFLLDKFTSGDNSEAYISNSIEDWRSFTNGFKTWNQNSIHIGTVLEFIISTEFGIEKFYEMTYDFIIENLNIGDYVKSKEYIEPSVYTIPFVKSDLSATEKAKNFIRRQRR